MDECRFDNLTRVFSAIRDRRAAVKELAGAGAAVLALARADLGFAQEDDVLVEGCQRNGARCSRDNQCCSNKCHRKRRKKRNRDHDGDNRKQRREDGECRCLKAGRSCRKDAACCKGRCDPNDRRCRCVPNEDICNKDDDCCDRRKCENDLCKG